MAQGARKRAKQRTREEKKTLPRLTVAEFESILFELLLRLCAQQIVRFIQHLGGFTFILHLFKHFLNFNQVSDFGFFSLHFLQLLILFFLFGKMENFQQIAQHTNMIVNVHFGIVILCGNRRIIKYLIFHSINQMPTKNQACYEQKNSMEITFFTFETNLNAIKKQEVWKKQLVTLEFSFNFRSIYS